MRLDPRALGFMVMSGLLGLVAGPSRAQWHSPHSDFQALSLADMDSVRVKLTYGGPRGGKVATLLIVRTGTAFKIAGFMPFRTPGFDYANDDSSVAVAGATAHELKAIIDGAGRIPGVAGGTADPNGHLSFALLSTAGAKAKMFEAIVNDSTGRGILAAIFAALQDDKDATRKLRAFGCAAAMLPEGPQADVASQVTVGLASFKPDLMTRNQLVARVVISNHSSATIAGPLTLVVMPRSGSARLLGEDGFTCAIEPAGVAFVGVSVGTGLAPGASVERGLRFISPRRAKFDLDFKVFAGPGSR